MFSTIRPPRIIDERILTEPIPETLQNNQIVVISVIGFSEALSAEGQRGDKRAFKLILDAFGNLSLASSRSSSKSTEKDTKTDTFITTATETRLSPEPEPGSAPSELKSEEGVKSKPERSPSGNSLNTGTIGDENTEAKPKATDDNDLGFRRENVKRCNSSEVEDENEGQGPPAKKSGQNGHENDNKRIVEHKKCYGEITGFYNEQESILFLQLSGAFDKKLLLEEFANARFDENNGFLTSYLDIKSRYYQAILFLFSISHIVIFSNTKSYFDTNYIHLFRTLDAARQHSLPKVIDLLSSLKDELPTNWIDNGRLCSPRVLFLFEMETESPKRISKICSIDSTNPLSEMRDNLTEEIYQILRKCRIITNISSNSLFALPKDPECIFLYDRSVQNLRFEKSHTDDLLDLIVKSCDTTTTTISTSSTSPSSKSKPTSTPRPRFLNRQEDELTYKDTVEEFRTFVNVHKTIAREKGFFKDSKTRRESKLFFVLPTLSQWVAAYNKLSSFFLQGPDFDPKNETLAVMKKYIDIDSEYLQIQCDKMFPIIFSIYTKNLPDSYSKSEHKARLDYCINLYYNISRGPGITFWQNLLIRKCENYWQRRQQCSELSLLEHECTNPIHRVHPDDHLEIIPVPEMDKSLPIMPHSTRYRNTSYCNCGRRQGQRDEPFTIREANYDFYKKESFNCCGRYERYRFPKFVNKESGVKIIPIDEMIQIIGKKAIRATNPQLNGIQLDQIDMLLENTSQPIEIENELRQANILEEDEDLDDDEEDLKSGDEEQQQDIADNDKENSDSLEKSNQSENKIEEITEVDQKNTATDPIPNETTTTASVNGNIIMENVSSSSVEYIPGMFHSKNAMFGLLPKFSSWSLLCIGSSSLYAHNTGISPQQPGFLSHACHLLPWDCLVKVEQGVTKPIPRLIRGRKPSNRCKRLSDEFTVKIFIGNEYECRRGHRFILNSTDKIISFTNTNLSTKEIGNVMRDNASKVAYSEMPLYFKCPCNREIRENSQRFSIAQLMRIHIVTPKAPVHVEINPRVQPSGSPCPIFLPENNAPIRLSSSSYWVLRLPYCYVGDHVYNPPNSDQVEYHGKLLKGFYNVVPMNQEETKKWEKDSLISN